MSTQQIKRKITPILRRRGVRRAALFGSAARGAMKKNSDVDVLVDLQNDDTLLDLVALKLDMEKILGRKVDVLTYRSLHPLLRDRILSEQDIVYEKRS